MVNIIFKLGAEMIKVICTTFMFECSKLLYGLFFMMYHPVSRINKITRIPSIFLSSGYPLFLPLMSSIFSHAKKYNQQGRAQGVLIMMVSIEIIRILDEPIFDWGLRKSAEKLIGLLWVVFLVYIYTPLQEISVGLFTLCVYFAVYEILKGVMFNIAKESYLIGKNPKLIHNYVKRVMSDSHLKTIPMNRCDYIVMGEENHEIAVCSNGYQLGKSKSKSKGMLTVGRVFELNLSNRDTCLSFALGKMLRRRFAKLPIDEAGCRKAFNFVREGLINYIGNNKDIQTHGNDGEINPVERVFSIIQEELQFVSDFLHIEVPIHHYFSWSKQVDAMNFNITLFIGIYLSCRILVVGDSYSDVSLAVVIILYVLLSIQLILSDLLDPISEDNHSNWRSLKLVGQYLKDSSNWNRSGISRSFHLEKKQVISKAQGENAKEYRIYSSVLDAEVEINLFCIKLDVSILERLPKWIRRHIPRLSPTIVHSTGAKEAILRFLSRSGGRLTNGETSLKNYGMKHLNWVFQINCSTTEDILVWHIATTLLDHQGPLPKQNKNPKQNPASQKKNNRFKNQEVALELSSYCLYLVACLPELLPDEGTEETYISLRKEIAAIAQFFDHKPTKKDHCNYALHAMWVENSVVGKGVKLSKDLMNYTEQRKQVWEMLANFWAEMMLFIAPSDNVDGHEKILDQNELITQLWALLTHAGIVTRPESTHSAGIVTRPKRTQHPHQEVKGDIHTDSHCQ